jgi:phosphohistidine phosphatase
MSRRVLLVRHASAVPRATGPDAERMLTPRGRRRFERVARGLAVLLPRPDVLLTSPWTRARETAVLLARAWGGLVPRETLALTQADTQAVAALLREQTAHGLIVLVGHEPQLASLLARVLGSDDAGPFAFRKGGAALVEWPSSRAPSGRLLWFLPPKVLRQVARA